MEDNIYIFFTGNLGPSFIAGFGSFKGGALIVEREDGHGEKEYDVKSKLVSYVFLHFSLFLLFFCWALLLLDVYHQTYLYTYTRINLTYIIYTMVTLFFFLGLMVQHKHMKQNLIMVKDLRLYIIHLRFNQHLMHGVQQMMLEEYNHPKE